MATRLRAVAALGRLSLSAAGPLCAGWRPCAGPGWAGPGRAGSGPSRPPDRHPRSHGIRVVRVVLRVIVRPRRPGSVPPPPVRRRRRRRARALHARHGLRGGPRRPSRGKGWESGRISANLRESPRISANLRAHGQRQYAIRSRRCPTAVRPPPTESTHPSSLVGGTLVKQDHWSKMSKPLVKNAKNGQKWSRRTPPCSQAPRSSSTPAPRRQARASSGRRAGARRRRIGPP
jgi:hypothetical protein